MANMQNIPSLFQQGKWEEIDQILSAVPLQECSGEICLYWIIALLKKGVSSRAYALIDQSIEIYPTHLQLLQLGAQAFQNMDVLKARKLWDEAVQCGCNTDVGYVQAGLYRFEKQDLKQAKAYFKNALGLDPKIQVALNSLGIIALTQGNFEKAYMYFRRLLDVVPTNSEVIVNLAKTFLYRGEYAEAEQFLRSHLKQSPENAYFHVQLAFALLWQQKYQEGWEHYEWRWHIPEFTERNPRPNVAPHWQGESLKGKRVLIFGEQGYGDIFQFSRFVTQCSEAAEAVFLVKNELVQVLSKLQGVNVVDSIEGQAPFDYQLALLSLPHVLKVKKIDCLDVPYLSFPKQPKREGKTLRVGYSWRGNVEDLGNPPRGFDFVALQALLEMEDIEFYRLEKSPFSDREASIAEGKVYNQGPLFQDFYDTAAFIETLDLVVSVDTGVAHLAAAMGKPVYLILQPQGDWRWLQGRIDSPWYPTLKIYRTNQQSIYQCIDDIKVQISKKTFKF